jgi:hypothetical protein
MISPTRPHPGDAKIAWNLIPRHQVNVNGVPFCKKKLGKGEKAEQASK